MSNAIIVGVTDAPVTRRVIDWAATRAHERHQPLVLLAVVPKGTGTAGETAVVDALMNDARELLDVRSAPLRERGLEVETRIDRDDPVAALVTASQDAALLVIGSDIGPGRRSRGSRSIRIAAGAHCPVVVVPDVDLDDRSGVVVGVDGSETSERAIAFAASEADRLHEPLIAVTTWLPLGTPRNPGVYPEEYLKNMQAGAAESLGLSVAGLRQDYPDLVLTERTERGRPADVISGLAATARLVVLGTHGRGAVAKFLLGSVSHEVLIRLATTTAVIR